MSTAAHRRCLRAVTFGERTVLAQTGIVAALGVVGRGTEAEDRIRSVSRFTAILVRSRNPPLRDHAKATR